MAISAWMVGLSRFPIAARTRAMPVHIIHATVWVAFICIWAMIGQFAIRGNCGPSRQGETLGGGVERGTGQKRPSR